MIQISQIKCRPDEGAEALRAKVSRILHLRREDDFSMQIRRKSVDARKKPDIFYVFTVDVTLKDPGTEQKILGRNRDRNVIRAQEVRYTLPAAGTGHGRKAEDGNGGKFSGKQEALRPVIVGTGPAGLFCGLSLARAGLRPVLIERGQSVLQRTETVARFWEGGRLNPESNVQFGEGGAGTFSDGKLNTGVKDAFGRIRFVLETFVEAGADPDILYSYKPHIGTDVLRGAVAHIRDEIIALGGEVRFSEKLICVKPAGKAGSCQEREIWEIVTERQQTDKGSGTLKTRLLTDVLVLAVGHSARDTFRMLYDAGLSMTAKAFAVGLRIQHPQGMIDRALYGAGCPYEMPPAPYKLTHRLPDGRGVYSFCMCPGGYVVNASSEEGLLAVNGMSNHDRGSGFANSAIVVTVSPQDIRGYLSDSRRENPDLLQTGRPDPELFAGVEFQRRLERAAFLAGRGAIPVQTFGAYREAGRNAGSSSDAVHRAPSLAGPALAERPLCSPEDLTEAEMWKAGPKFRGQYAAANVRRILPEQIARAIEEGILAWDRQIHGFADSSALLAGVESRTSSPIRIERGEDLQAIHFPGIYPCGEGAGYAGGITSAAVDGLRVAEAITALAR